MADALALGASAFGRRGSSPLSRTTVTCAALHRRSAHARQLNLGEKRAEMRMIPAKIQSGTTRSPVSLDRVGVDATELHMDRLTYGQAGTLAAA